MEQAQAYYDSLLESGYDVDAAYGYTKGHFPEFSLETGGFQDTEVVDSVTEDANSDDSHSTSQSLNQKSRIDYFRLGKWKIQERIIIKCFSYV